MTVVHKNSKKRQAILDAIMSTRDHPSAEWIYATLKPDYPDLSLGTVYRNLGVFREEGQVISVGTVNGQERFDGNTAPHPHFVCRGCGRVLDVDAPVLDEAEYEKLGRENGLEVTGAQLILTGLCGECAKTQGQEE